jgi:DNA-binding NarL/FixJ family response regulator
MKRVRILLADDHAMICAAFQKFLEPEYEVIGSVGDGRALLLKAAEMKPDVVLLDIAMPLLNGLDAARELKRIAPQIKLIFVTMNPDTDLAAEAFRIGASAYLLKNSQGSELLKAVQQAMKGIRYVTAQIGQAMEEAFIRDPRALARARHLTGRQAEVLQMLAEGRSMKVIAHVLRITHRTVRYHKSSIMEELQISTNSELVQYAMKHGMLSPCTIWHNPLGRN